MCGTEIVGSVGPTINSGLNSFKAFVIVIITILICTYFYVVIKTIKNKVSKRLKK